MLIEYETKIELMGRQYPAQVRYELDPSDGHPLIDSVEIGRVIESWDYERDVPTNARVALDVTAMIYEDQISALEDEIDSAMQAEAEAMVTDRKAMEREERGLFRRAD